MSKYMQGIFTPKNPQKYVGRGSIKYRSSWEFHAMNFFDLHEGIIQWASESIHIPYRNPFTGKNTIYVPDFFLIYCDKDGKQHAELVEIKPSKEMMMENARSLRDKAAVALNQAKWSAANAFCKAHGIKFRIITEKDLFFQGKK